MVCTRLGAHTERRLELLFGSEKGWEDAWLEEIWEALAADLGRGDGKTLAFSLPRECYGLVGDWLLGRAGEGPAASECSEMFYGPEQWTRTCLIDRLLAPNLENQEQFSHFYGLSARQAQWLLLLTPRLALADRQNNSPQLWELLRACARHPGQVYLDGYLVGPGRADERYTCDLVFVCDEPLKKESSGREGAETTAVQAREKNSGLEPGTSPRRVKSLRPLYPPAPRLLCLQQWQRTKELLQINTSLSKPDEAYRAELPAGGAGWAYWWD